jgi:hypothetical protein
VWIRLTRVGGRYICDASLDGANWDRAISFTWKFYGTEYAALIAKNGASSTAKSIPAHFDFIEIREVKTYTEIPADDATQVLPVR